MPMIRELPSHLVNRIAAGEVVENAASIIKEIAENAIDAKATHIEIYIENAGKSVIRIKDNGHGIEKNELPLVIKRHFTSKCDDENLIYFPYLGFRGEAMASIASVSKLTIDSSQKNDDENTNMRVEGGDIISVSPSPKRDGTMITIQDLFYNTPARLKFLSSDRTEIMTIRKIVESLALSYPHIHFQYYENNQEKYHFPIHKDGLEKRVEDVLGKEFVHNMMFFDQKKYDIHMQAYLSLPTFSSNNSRKLYIFINGRFIIDKRFTMLLRTAYQDVLFSGKFPVGFISLNMPHELIDVNAHPTKREVRIKNWRELSGLLIKTIRETIRAQSHRVAQSDSNKILSNEVQYQESFMQKISHSFDDDPMKEKDRSYREKNGLREIPSPFHNASSFEEVSSSAFALKDDDAYFSQDREKNITPEENTQNTDSRSMSDARIEEKEPLHGNEYLGDARAQIASVFIVAETQDAMVIVDQHAAHERLVYEKLKKQYYGKPVVSQQLLQGEIIDMDEDLVEQLIHSNETLLKLGIDIEKFGEKAVIVKAIPALLAAQNIHDLLRQLAEDLLHEDFHANFEKNYIIYYQRWRVMVLFAQAGVCILPK